MPGQNEPQRLRGVVADDPLTGRPVGHQIPIEPVVFGGSDAKVAPEGVTNWDFFEGSLLAVGVRRRTGVDVLGTAVMVAPALALGATHVLADDLADLLSGNSAAFAVGVRPGNLDLWKLRSISTADDDDLAFLSLELMSSLSEGWRFTSIPVTTRCPVPGEVLTIVGFRFVDIEEPSDTEMTAGKRLFSMGGQLFAASGTTVGAHYPIRDRVLMPFPTIEIACGVLHGMSGGAVLDSNGMLMGTISRGWDDPIGPTYAGWVIKALGRRLQIPWPPGVYDNDVAVLDIPEQLLHVAGREAIVPLQPSGYRYRVWFDVPLPVAPPDEGDGDSPGLADGDPSSKGGGR